jgi:hypothetical protein
MVARGIRGNNPGNLRKTADKWQGLAQLQSDPEFFTFKDPVYGIRALARTLISYQDKYGLRTIFAIINRWAPAVENNTNAYIDAVCKRTRRGARTTLDLHSHEDLRPLVEAIIWHENGSQPYTRAQIDKALVLAGVETPVKSLSSSRTVNACTVAAASTGGTAVIEAVQQAQDVITPLTDYLSIAKYILLGLVLISVGYTVYARWDDFRRLAR